ncbi:MAG: M23 family metallopeptidase [Proteobacteria bacterium]|nr:M23 family metallopeptidase [Pseudomonadota bacterium]
MDPGKGAKDYMCGPLSYNTHKGTDIRLKTVSQMDEGVAVLAAADGKVVKVRDGIEDQYFEDYTEEIRAQIRKLGLGNAIIVSHGDGWSSIYSHLKKGSLKVTEGQKIKKGDPLGYVGMSGLTSFPHLHFQVMSRKKVIDPFSGPQKTTPCTHTEKNLWTPEARSLVTYVPTGLLSSGFSIDIPKSRRQLESGEFHQETLSSNSPTLIFSALYFGSQKGDIVEIRIKNPDGEVLREYVSKPAQKDQISKYFYSGVKRPKAGWKKGLYRGEFTLRREGFTLQDNTEITVQ